MSLVKAAALLLASLLIQGAPLAADGLIADCGAGAPGPRLIGLDRSDADVCNDRFAIAADGPAIEKSPANASPSIVAPLQPALPVGEAGRCVRFMPALALTVEVACESRP